MADTVRVTIGGKTVEAVYRDSPIPKPPDIGDLLRENHELRAEVARLRAALVEDRATLLASAPYRIEPSERGRAAARTELRAEGLLPPE